MSLNENASLSGIRLVSLLAERGVACTALPPNPNPNSEDEYLWALGPWRTTATGSIECFEDGVSGLVMRTGDGLDVLDFDKLDDLGLTIEDISGLLHEWDIEPVAIVRSPRGLHVWILSTGLSCSSDSNAGIDYRGVGGCVHIPGSTRPKYSGSLGYEFVLSIRNVDCIPDHDSVRGLMAAMGAGVLPRVAQRLPSSELSSAIASEVEGPRHRRFFALVAMAKTEGLTEAETCHALYEWGLRTEKYTSTRAVEAEVARCWPKIDTSMKWRDSRPMLPELARIQGAIDRTVWAGRTGSRDRNVLEAILSVCAKAYRLKVRVSARQIAEMCGINKETASTAVRRLETAGWIIRYSPQNHGEAQSVEVLTCEGDPSALDTRNLGHDAFRRGALGEVARFLMRHPVESMAIKEIAFRSGFSPDQVRTALRNLQWNDAARIVGRRGNAHLWTVEESIDLEAIAKQCGTAGRGLRTVEVHARQRMHFRAETARYIAQQADEAFERHWAGDEIPDDERAPR